MESDDSKASNYSIHEVIDTDYSCDKIEDNLYLGDSYTIRSLDRLKKFNISRVLSIINSTVTHYEGIIYKQIHAEDYDWVDLLTTFPECIQFITDGHDSGQTVYVHCLAGVSRSPTIVIAFLMHKYKIPYESARKRVSDKRNIYPNPGFVEQLKLFESMNFTVDVNRKEYIDYLKSIENFVH